MSVLHPLNLTFNDYEMRLSTTRSDLQPEYQGYAVLETPTSANVWTIYKFTYGTDGDLQRRQVRFKINWDNRATSF